MLAARALTGRITSTWFAAVPSVASYTSLYLSVNLIISIDPAALGALTSLRYIDLSTNQVAGLEAGTFQANTRLTTLCVIVVERATQAYRTLMRKVVPCRNLAVNRIASLPAGVFSSLSQLQALYVPFGSVCNHTRTGP
ncbi:LRRNT domain-containing protein [Plasmodiophora brassicae]